MYEGELMNYPALPSAACLERLRSPTDKMRMVLDTDTGNEIDDQFAVVYTLVSPDGLNVEAIFADPFHSERSSGPTDEMEKGYEETL